MPKLYAAFFLYVGNQLALYEATDSVGAENPYVEILKIFQGGMGTCAKIRNLENKKSML